MALKFVEQQKKMPRCLGMIVAAEQSQSQHQIVDVVSYDVLKKNTGSINPCAQLGHLCRKV